MKLTALEQSILEVLPDPPGSLTAGQVADRLGATGRKRVSVASALERLCSLGRAARSGEGYSADAAASG